MSSGGQVAHGYVEDMCPENFKLDRIAETCEKYKDKIIGLKIRQSIPIVKEYGLRPLKRAVEIANEVGLRLSVHSSNAPGEVKDTMDILRPGDIYCHAFHDQGKTILDENGKVLPAVLEAKEKGILSRQHEEIHSFLLILRQKLFHKDSIPILSALTWRLHLQLTNRLCHFRL